MTDWQTDDDHWIAPTIEDAVLEYMDALGTRPYYDDDATRYVQERVGAHVTSREVYDAKNAIRDREARATEQQLIADGYAPLAETTLSDNTRYMVMFGTMYCGYSVPRYSKPHLLKAKRHGDRWFFMKPRARTHGIVPTGPTLVKELSAVES